MHRNSWERERIRQNRGRRSRLHPEQRSHLHAGSVAASARVGVRATAAHATVSAASAALRPAGGSQQSCAQGRNENPARHGNIIRLLGKGRKQICNPGLHD